MQIKDVQIKQHLITDSVEELQNMHLLLRGDKLGLELNCKEGGKTESMNISKKEILQNNIHKNG